MPIHMPSPAEETDNAELEESFATARDSKGFASSVMSYSSIGDDDGSYVGTLNAEDILASQLSSAVIAEDAGG